jgi:hypothetical protein
MELSFEAVAVLLRDAGCGVKKKKKVQFIFLQSSAKSAR